MTVLTSPEACERDGALLATVSSAPLIIALAGDLGAGKTCFTRGFVEAVAAGADVPVSSPTWAVCNTYPTRPPVHHLDLYRLESEDDLESIGFWELLDGAFVLVEWPDRVDAVARMADVRVTLDVLSPSTRRLTATGLTPRGRSVVQAWGEARST